MTGEAQHPATIEDLRRRLAEAEQTIGAFTRGEIDAVVDAALATPILLKQAQDELRRREQLLRAIFDGVGEGILLVDSQGVYLDANPAACSLFGLPKSELIGRRIEDFALGFDASAERARFRSAGQGRGVVRILRADGSARDLEYSATKDILPDVQLAVLRDVTDRKRAEEATRASEERYRLLFESSPMAVWLVDVDTLTFLAVNQAGLQVFGYARAEFLALTAADLLVPEERQRVHEIFPALVGEAASHVTWRPIKQDGSTLEIALTAQTFLLEGRPVRLCIGQDLSERNRLEAQLAQSRKMEAIGILAGGVAHDFNNLLSIMVTYTAFALEVLPPGDALRSDIEQVAQAGERATALTHQLLAFSRQQILEPKIVDLNATLAGLEPMLRRLLGETIEIALNTEPLLGRISADPGQVEQVIMNLVVNARDAMPDGGELTIETANFAAAEPPNGPSGFKPSAYVRLSVSDTGLGMDSATRERIFEPFFTTKELGKGTGLGLSTVLGIIEQSDGYLEVRSVLGKGTTFDAFLPRVDRAASSPTVAPVSSAPIGGSETVLLVEDDEQVRKLSRSILRRNGYEVLAAANAGEAFLISEQHPGPIHLLLTDVMMPRMNGRQLAERLALTRPDMKVLFMTGYTDDAEVRQAALHSDVALLHKPITPLGLARRVRAVLDAAPTSARKLP